MKVKELRELIADMKEDEEVHFQMSSGCCGDYEEMDVVDSEVLPFDPYKPEEGSFGRILLGPLPGYTSCRQAGATKRAHQEYLEAVKGKQVKTPTE
jgi:hypothetical protein